MPRFLRLSWTQLTLFGILLYALCYSFFTRLEGDNWKSVIMSDGAGYYSYLPATFIYHDLSYSFIDTMHTRHPMLTPGCEFCSYSGGQRVNKYFAGEAVALAPFFLTAHLFASESEADGYSFPYAAGVSLGAIFYLLLGLWSSGKLMRRFGVSDGHTAVALAAVFFGTHLFYYALREQAMSHVYSFGLIAFFLLLLHRQLETFNPRRLFLLGLVLGLITITRPVNMLIVLALPFLAGSWKSLRTFFSQLFRHPLALLAAAAAFAAMLFLQLGYYYAASGRWYVYSYNKEGFDFAHPHFFSSLFSYSNGLFVYAPLLLVAMTGLLTLVRRSLFRFAAFLLFFCAVTWVISSWWAWTYGAAFGMRPFVEYIPLFALLLGQLLSTLAKKRFLVPAMIVLVVLPLIALAQLQTWQYGMGILAQDNMTKEKYWQVFLETRRQFYYTGIYAGQRPIPRGASSCYKTLIDFERPVDGVDWRSVDSRKPFSGKHSVCLREGNSHPPYLKWRVGDLVPDSVLNAKKLWLNVHSKWLVEDNGTEARMIVNLQRGGNMAVYEEHYVLHQVITEEKWTDVHVVLPLGHCLPDDTIAVYPRRDNWHPVYVDDVSVEVLAE